MPGCRVDPTIQTPQSSVRARRSEEHTSELQSLTNLVCRLLLEKKYRATRSTRDKGGTHALERSACLLREPHADGVGTIVDNHGCRRRFDFQYSGGVDSDLFVCK